MAFSIQPPDCLPMYQFRVGGPPFPLLQAANSGARRTAERTMRRALRWPGERSLRTTERTRSPVSRDRLGPTRVNARGCAGAFDTVRADGYPPLRGLTPT